MSNRVLVATEHEEQVALFEWMDVSRNKYPELDLAFAIPNGANKSIVSAKKFKAEGLKSGVPDVFLPIPRAAFHGMFVEMKRLKGGKVSPEQESWINALRDAGYFAVICAGWQDAAYQIEAYLKLSQLQIREREARN